MAEAELRITVDNSDALRGLKQVDTQLEELTRQSKQQATQRKASIDEMIAYERKLLAARNALSTSDVKKYKEANKALENVRAEMQRMETIGTRGGGVLGKVFGGLGQQMKALGAAAAAAFSVAAIVNFTKNAYRAYEEQQLAEKRLLYALKGRKSAQEDLINQANALRKSSSIDDAEIIRVQALAATHNLTTNEIKKTTVAALGLAQATGVDINTAVQQLLQTYEGLVGRLAKNDEAFGKLTDAQLKNGDAVDLAIRKYSSFVNASATASSMAASEWDEFSERFGKSVSGAFNGALNAFAAFMNGISGTGISETIATEASMLTIDQLKEKLDKATKAVEFNQEQIKKGGPYLKERIALTNKLALEQATWNAQLQKAVTNDMRETAAKRERLGEEKKFLAEIRALTLSQLETKKDEVQADEAKVKLINKEIKRRQEAAKASEKQAEKAKKLAEAQQKYQEETIAYLDKYSTAIQESDDELTKIEKNRLKQISEETTALNALQKQAKEAGQTLSDEVLWAYLDTIDKINQAAEQEKIVLRVDLAIEGGFKERLSFEDTLKKSVRDRQIGLTQDIQAFWDDLENNPQYGQVEINLASLLGIDLTDPKQQAKWKEAVAAAQQAAQTVFANIQSIFAAQSQIAANRTSIAEQALSDAETELERKKQLTEEGIYFDIAAEQKKIELLKQERDKARAEEERLAKQQMLIDTAMQLSSLITASANIWKSFTALGPAGPPLAIAAMALMFGSFAAAKIKAAEATGGMFEEGGKVEGKRHSEGGVIVEAEGGEWIINRKASVKYNNVLEAINEGDDNAVSKAIAEAGIDGKTLHITEQGDIVLIERQTQTEEALKNNVAQVMELVKTMQRDQRTYRTESDTVNVTRTRTANVKDFVKVVQPKIRLADFLESAAVDVPDAAPVDLVQQVAVTQRYDGLLDAINDDTRQRVLMELNGLIPSQGALKSVIQASAMNAITANVQMQGVNERLERIEAVLTKSHEYIKNRPEIVSDGKRIIQRTGNSTKIINNA